jgi:hypothetical protein
MIEYILPIASLRACLSPGLTLGFKVGFKSTKFTEAVVE